jgi:hypothetical protein
VYNVAESRPSTLSSLGAIRRELVVESRLYPSAPRGGRVGDGLGKWKGEVVDRHPRSGRG